MSARTLHGQLLYEPGEGEAETSIWATTLEGDGICPQNRSNPARGEAWYQVQGDAIRPSTSPLTDDYWSVATEGDEQVFRIIIELGAITVTPLRESPSGTKDGNNTIFTTTSEIDTNLPYTVILNHEIIDDYSLSADEITMDTAPAVTDLLEIVYYPAS